MRGRRFVALLVVGLIPLATACSGTKTQKPDRFPVGGHTVEIVVPPEWRRADQGDRQRFEDGLNRITLTDLGPATHEAFGREIRQARELFRASQYEDARLQLERIRLRRAFPTAERWESVGRLWEAIRDAGSKRPPDRREVDRSYGAILVHVGALGAPDLTAIAEAALDEVGHDERRDIAEREREQVDGRPAVRIDTWDRLSHTQRKRHLFVLVDGDLLVLHMGLGQFPAMESPFEELSRSLTLLETPDPVS